MTHRHRLAAALGVAGPAVLGGWLFSWLTGWAEGAFARPLMGSALVSAVEAVLFVALLCLAPPLSRLAGRALRVPMEPASGTSGAASAMLGALAGGLFVAVIELVASLGAHETPGLLAALALIGCAAALAAPAALLIGSLARAGTVDGPATPLSTGALLRVARLPIGRLLLALGWITAIGAGLTWLRAGLLDRPALVGAIDLAAWSLALAGAALLGRGAAAGRLGLPPRRVGLLVAGAAALGGLVMVTLRPSLLPSGLWDLALIGAGAALGAGVALARPPLSTRRAALAVGAALLVGLGAVTLLDRSADTREQIAASWRPAVWIVEAGMSLVDADRDGFSPLFGGGDCDDSQATVNPEAVEIPGNGVDENCTDGDRAAEPPWPLRPTHVALPPGVEKPRGIVVVMVDTLRRDHVGVYGYDRDTTPRLDRFAAGAMRFDRAYTTAPSTRIAVPSLLTGRTLGEIAWDRSKYPFGLDDRNVTFAEALRDAGFATGAFVAHRFLGPRWNFMQGFEHIDDTQAFESSTYRTKITGRKVAQAAAKWIEAHKDQPFLAFVHFFDPHDTYLEHQGGAEFGDRAIDRYDEEIAYTDRWFGYLLDRLEALGLAETTAVVFLSDHGEFFGEHGRTFHGGSVYEEVAAIPMLIRVPGLPAGVTPCVTPHHDIAPTLLDLVGIDGSKHGMSAASLLPELLGRACDPAREIVVETRFERRSGRDLRALVGQRYKLIHDVRAGSYRLYDLTETPTETTDIRRLEPERFAAMRDRLRAWTAYYANRGYADLLADVVREALPPEAEPLAVEWANGLRLAAVDFGTRTLDVDNPIFARLFFHRTGEVDAEDCWVGYRVVDADEKRIYGETHAPLNGQLEVRLWPRNRYITDNFIIQKRRKLNRYGALPLRLDLRCGGETVEVVSGPTDAAGRVMAGEIEVRKSKRNRKARKGRKDRKVRGQQAKKTKKPEPPKTAPGERPTIRQLTAPPQRLAPIAVPPRPLAPIGPVGPVRTPKASD